MPPKPKFTKEKVVSAALEIVSEKGIEALTARELGERLGSSARPIFTVFKNMEELSNEVRLAAMHRFEEYATKAVGYTPLLKKVGMQMVLFACEEPKLYKLLFMSENKTAESFDDVLKNLGITADMCLKFLKENFGFGEKDAMIFFEQIWIYTFGIGAMCATGMCRFSEKELVQMLGTDFAAMMMLAKAGKLDAPSKIPQKTVDKPFN